MCLIVGRKSLDECILRVEFQKSPKSLSQIAPGLLSELLQENGTGAPEVSTWAAEIKDKTIEFRGRLSESTLDGLLGIVSLKSVTHRTSRMVLSDVPSPSNKDQLVAQSTKHFFDEVTNIVERTRQHKSQSSGALAVWNDKRARQIDELPTLNVRQRSGGVRGQRSLAIAWERTQCPKHEY